MKHDTDLEITSLRYPDEFLSDIMNIYNLYYRLTISIDK